MASTSNPLQKNENFSKRELEMLSKKFFQNEGIPDKSAFCRKTDYDDMI